MEAGAEERTSVTLDWALRLQRVWLVVVDRILETGRQPLRCGLRLQLDHVRPMVTGLGRHCSLQLQALGVNVDPDELGPFQ